MTSTHIGGFMEMKLKFYLLESKNPCIPNKRSYNAGDGMSDVLRNRPYTSRRDRVLRSIRILAAVSTMLANFIRIFLLSTTVLADKMSRQYVGRKIWFPHEITVGQIAVDSMVFHLVGYPVVD
ncbi:hypothetical protein PC110_g13516 [Phytophthora cactorum]|uniref:Uncharacterized protein n=1 Tax=Phytophthora cactorum TaxID=29920 RepID=A0A329S050_9STRA|nr:hypothetical protein PC110_g13516 [Phytophthora cactorum]